MPGCCGCLSNAVIGTCASIYLIIGVAIIAGGFATFVTPVGQVILPGYAVASIGAGIAVFIIACVGLCAACESKQRVCTLYLFTFLTFVMIAASVCAVVVIFEYESFLSLASAAGGEAVREDVDSGVERASAVVDEAGTAAIEMVATNAFYACGATVNATLVPFVYNFACANEQFAFLQTTLNSTCMNPELTAPINASSGSLFSYCYSGGAFESWASVDAFGNPVPLATSSSSGVLAALNTPKGTFCACSSTLIDTYLLPYLVWAKLSSIVVCVFFLVVAIACFHQLCQRGCCGGKGMDEQQRKREVTMHDIQMTYPEPSKSGKKGAQRLNDGGYIARP